MNKKTISTLLASILIFITGTVSADSEGKRYIGIQYGVADYSEKGISKNFNPTALIGRYGYYFYPSLSIEGRLGFGVRDDTKFVREFGTSGLDATLELGSILGIYGTGHISLAESLSLYGILGVSRVEATASVPAFPAADSTEDEVSFSYGIGTDISLGKNIALNIEYMKYLDKDNLDLGVIGAGVVFNF